MFEIDEFLGHSPIKELILDPRDTYNLWIYLVEIGEEGNARRKSKLKIMDIHFKNKHP